MANWPRNSYRDGITITFDNLAFSNACTIWHTAATCPKIDILLKRVSYPFWVLEQQE
jgi:hypothetical protein